MDVDIIECDSNSVRRLLDFGYEVLDKDTDEELVIFRGNWRMPFCCDRLKISECHKWEKCYGYRRSSSKIFVFYCLTILSLGILFLVTRWKPSWRVVLTCLRCQLSDADCVLLEDQELNVFHASVVVHDVSHESTEGTTQYVSFVSPRSSNHNDIDDTSVLSVQSREVLRYFDHRNVRYLWSLDRRTFQRVIGLQTNLTCVDFLTKFSGLSKEAEKNKLALFGKNAIEIEVKSYFKLFFEEILNPFYVFQIFSVVWWCLDSYYIFAGCIVLISLISLSVELYEIRKQRETLRDMVSSRETTVSVILSNNVIQEVSTSNLVPGDLIIIPANGFVVPCDAVLTVGSAIVDESMLTGESVPVTKTQLAPSSSNEFYSPDTHKRNTLFCGTRVIQTRYYGGETVRAVVLRTGFCTAKGNLVRSILYPKEIFFKFYQDAMKFVIFLACVAGVGMIYVAVFLSTKQYATWTIIKRVFDVITVAVPPSLPAAMTVGSIYAQSRLKKVGIFCLSPQRINLCGKLQSVCFDKTGTLTEEGLDLAFTLPVENCCFLEHVSDARLLAPSSAVAAAMATCHSLTFIDGKLSGDPLDLSMFNAVNWVFLEPGQDATKFDSLAPVVVKPVTREEYSSRDSDDVTGLLDIGILRQFTFSSSVQCMSVIVRKLGSEHMDVFVKGAPEKIVSRCLPETALELSPIVISPPYLANELHLAADARIHYRLRLPVSAGDVSVSDIDTEPLYIQCLRTSGLMAFIGHGCHQSDGKLILVPQDYHRVLHTYAISGMRVIALASRSLSPKITWLQSQHISREEVERDLHFIGLLIFENKLKPETSPVIAQLHDAGIRMAMVTGDNILTAVSVSRQCGMLSAGDQLVFANAYPPADDKPARISWELSVDDSGDQQSSSTVDVNLAMLNAEPNISKRCHLALTGRSFGIIRDYFPNLLPQICLLGTVFARMSPDNKSALIEELKNLGLCVGMCGDGANDCGALRTAHAGVSLSQAEASVASPFTSQVNNVSCVPQLIREGRAALVTSFGVFRYMALYSIVQFVSVTLLYSNEANLGDYMLLYIDLLVATLLVILMGHTGAYHQLVVNRPPSSLVTGVQVVSLLLHIAVVIIFQVAAYLYLLSQPWFAPNLVLPDHLDPTKSVTMEATVIFYVSSFQYIMLAFVLSKGPPFRKHIWTNIPFLVALVVLTVISIILMLSPPPFAVWLFQLMVLPNAPSIPVRFRINLLGIVWMNLFIVLLLEMVIIESPVFKQCLRLFSCWLGRSEKLHKKLKHQLDASGTWPPVGETTIATSVRNSGLIFSNC